MALTKIVVNCETGVTEEIELTPAEVAQVEAAQAQAVSWIVPSVKLLKRLRPQQKHLHKQNSQHSV
jgi:hypothetical protein